MQGEIDFKLETSFKADGISLFPAFFHDENQLRKKVIEGVQYSELV